MPSQSPKTCASFPINVAVCCLTWGYLVFKRIQIFTNICEIYFYDLIPSAFITLEKPPRIIYYSSLLD